MKKLLLFVSLFLTSFVGFLQAQCPSSVSVSSDTSCLYLSFEIGQDPPDTIIANGLTYINSDSIINGFTVFSQDTSVACDSADMIEFVGDLEYMVGADTMNCQYEGGTFQPPCPDSALILDGTFCIRIVTDPGNVINLPDSIDVNGTPYVRTSDDMIYSFEGVECPDSMETLFGGELMIGPSVCTYDEGLLPITILSFDFEDNEGVVDLSWEVNSDQPTNKLFLQKSYDGVDWMDVYEQNLGNYAIGEIMDGRYTDRAIEQPKVYYRLYIAAVQGEAKYSNILPVTMKDKVINTLFFQSQSRSIMIKAGQNFSGEMYLFNTQGQNVMTTQVQMQKDTYQEIDVQGHLTPGIYFVKFDNGLIPPSKIFID